MVIPNPKCRTLIANHIMLEKEPTVFRIHPIGTFFLMSSRSTRE